MKLKDLEDYCHKYPKRLGYVLIVSSLVLFTPYLFTVMLSSFVAIMMPKDLPVFLYLTLLGESFLLQYMTTAPATILLIFGVIKFKKNKN
ncbi:hypothetical protein K0U27_01880 [archaeon]|nr:hypothetical protein [archaeon]